MTMIKAVGFEFNTILEANAGNGHAIVSTEKRSGSYSMDLYGSTVAEFGNWFQIALDAAHSELFIQFAPRYPYISLLNWGIMRWYSGATVGGGLRLNTDGTISVYTGNFSTLVGRSTGVLTGGVFQVVEVRIKIAANPNGIIQLRMNGSLEVDFAGATNPSSITSIQSFQWYTTNTTTSGHHIQYDDIIFNDPNGSVNNSWPNGLKIALLKPTADGTHEEWTPSTGTDNYALVDELPPVITDYLEAGSDGLRDTYVIEDCPANMGTIAAVIPSYWCQKTGTPACENIKRLMRISSTDYAGSDMAVPSSYGLVQEILEVSPATSNAFTESEVNGLEFGQQSAT